MDFLGLFFILELNHTQNLSWSPIRIHISLFSAIKSQNSISLPLTHNTNAQPFYLYLHHLHILHFQRQTLGLFICWICSCRHFLYYCFVARKFHQIFIQMKYIYIHRILLYCQKKRKNGTFSIQKLAKNMAFVAHKGFS